jgi:hypothetical protein
VGSDRGRLAAGVDAEFVEDVGDVGVDGAGREEEGLRDFLVGVALGEESQHLPLAPSEPTRR